MNDQFELDIDGYPTDAMLDAIRKWPSRDGWESLLDAIKPFWKHSDSGYWRKRSGIYHIATAGWSGNESIVFELQQNYLFWMMCWYESRRGGKYVFKVKDKEDEG